MLDRAAEDLARGMHAQYGSVRRQEAVQLQALLLFLANWFEIQVYRVRRLVVIIRPRVRSAAQPPDPQNDNRV